MTNSWLILCNATTAYIYDITRGKQDNPSRYSLVKQFEHPEGQMKGEDLISDKPGYHKSKNSGSGSFSARTDPHETVITDFARQLAKFLDTESHQNHYDQLVVCAEPHFHGVLEKQLSSNVKQHVTRHIHKDYIPLKSNKLDKVISDIQYNRL